MHEHDHVMFVPLHLRAVYQSFLIFTLRCNVWNVKSSAIMSVLDNYISVSCYHFIFFFKPFDHLIVNCNFTLIYSKSVSILYNISQQPYITLNVLFIAYSVTRCKQGQNISTSLYLYNLWFSPSKLGQGSIVLIRWRSNTYLHVFNSTNIFTEVVILFKINEIIKMLCVEYHRSLNFIQNRLNN